MKLKKYCIALLVFIIMMFTITGCPMPIGEKGEYEKDHLSLLKSNLVMNLQHIESSTVAQDSHGRELFSFKVQDGSWIGYKNHEAYGYAIIQKKTISRIYYYEDICFILSDEKMDSGDMVIENLKEANDWNNPINFEKCSSFDDKKEFKSHSLTLINDEERDAAFSHMQQSPIDNPDNILEFRYYDENKDASSGNPVIYYLTVKNSDIEDDRTTYLVVLGCYAENWFKVVDLCELEDIYNYQKQLHDLKVKHGWVFS